MLSIATIKGAGSAKAAAYYTKEYSEGVGEMLQTAQSARERSRWYGDGADRLGLDGPVDQRSLEAILAGRHPVDGQTLYDPAFHLLQGAKRYLGGEGPVTLADLEHFRDGKSPVDGTDLPRPVLRHVEALFDGRNPTGRSVSALDLTLSAPKSVSLMIAVGDEEIREAATAAHERAVDKAMSFIEDHLVAVRRGHGGGHQEKGSNITAGLVTQLASRNQDPQVHTHCVLSTAAMGEDGRYTALNAAMLHSASKVIGSVYQAELRHELTERLGVSWQVEQNGLGEVAAMPNDVLAKFSTRTRDVNDSIDAQYESDLRLIRDVELRLDVYERADVMVRRDPENASEQDRERAAKYADYHKTLRRMVNNEKYEASRKRLLVALTRKEKDEPAEAELRAEWQERWAATGVSWDSVLNQTRALRLLETERDEEYKREKFREAMSRSLTRGNATFGRKEVYVDAMRHADPSWDADRIRAEADAYISSIVEVRPDTSKWANWSLGGGAKWTTEEVIEQERNLKRMAAGMLKRNDVAVCDLELAAAKAAEFTLTDEQERMLAAMTISGKQLLMARGIAGSGKTHVLSCAAEVLRGEGYQVVGLATAAATAQRLSSESGFDRSSSIDRFLTLAENNKWERGLSAHLLERRGVLQDEKRDIEATYRQLAVEAGDDQEELNRLSLEKAERLEDWGRRWDNWLESSRKEQSTRERTGAELESRKEILDQIEEDLARRQQNVQHLSEVAAQEELASIAAEREELKAARSRWYRDSAEYRSTLSPTEDLPNHNKVVLVVDEAGMVETRHYHDLVELAEKKGWKVAFVGDDKQLQEVNRGGAFRMLTELGGSVELGSARRARDEWELAAQKKWWSTEDPDTIMEVAEEYVAQGRVTFVNERAVRTAIASEQFDPDRFVGDGAEREAARQMMLREFLKDYDAGIEHLLIASKRDDVYELNTAVQKELIERGEIDVDGPSARAADVRHGKTAAWYDLYAGDNVMVMSNIPNTAVKNGMRGKVESIDESGVVTVALPTGPEGEMRSHVMTKDDLESGRLALGNATTCHKSQGMSSEKASVLQDSSTSREAIYPGATRGKGRNQIYWIVDTKSELSPTAQLAQGMSRSERKHTALETLAKGVTSQEIKAVQEMWAADGIEVSYQEAHDEVMSTRRAEMLDAWNEAATRDAEMGIAMGVLEHRRAEMTQERTVEKSRM